MPGDASASNPKMMIVRNITSFSYSRYDRLDNATTSDASTKRVQMAMTVTSTAQTVATARDVVSASFVLRNKLAG